MPEAQVVQKIFWLGESIGFWAQTVAFFLSAFCAIWLIWSNGRQARKQATIKLMLHQSTDEELLRFRKIVVDLHRNGERILSRYLNDPISDECMAIQSTLNNYEFIASGIREGAFDEGIYKRARYSIVIKDWKAFKGVIQEIRNLHGETHYQEFEWLCCRWLERPLNKAWWKIW